MTIKADLRHVIYALSDALDLVGVDDVGHGKLRVPDDILDKPGKLDDRERRTINTHSFESYQILHHIKGFEETEFVALAASCGEEAMAAATAGS